MKISTRIVPVTHMPIPDPQYGDFKLNLFPFLDVGYVRLPPGFMVWEEALARILSRVPSHPGANQHYVTIDSKFFTTPGPLRREGVHADGNFCVDPDFGKATWGGTTTTWGGAKFDETLKVVKDWESPYDIEIPVGQYISSEKGGIFSVSTEVGCQGWSGDFEGEIGAEGDFSSMKDQLTDDRKFVFARNVLYFMTSNTPHETLVIDKGKRRTFLRVTLNHEYPNKKLRLF